MMIDPINSSLETCDKAIKEFQTSPNLLDKDLPELLRVLTSEYISNGNPKYLHLIYTLCKVRGYKVISQQFPTNPSLLVHIFTNLKTCPPQDWKSEYALILWVSTLVLIPFDLNTIQPNFGKEIYDQGVQYLASNGVQRDAGAVLLGRLVTRTRTKECDLMVSKLIELAKSSAEVYVGSLQALAVAMKRVSIVPPAVAQLIDYYGECTDNDLPFVFDFKSNLTLNRFWIKIIGRAAIISPESYAELSVTELFNMLDSDSSKLRYSAAKYLARIMSKLDNEALEQVFSALLETLSDEVRHASADYWQGSLLAIAETIGCCKTINPELISTVVDIIEVKGLHFMQDMLVSHIGGSVRDAACYVCWQLFRSKYLTSSDLRTRIYNSLICGAIMDSEVNVRRAAAAALHEGLGRFGASAGDLDAQKMFDLIEKVNFQSVSLMQHCYSQLLPQFQTTENFTKLYIMHALSTQPCQRLASENIGKLAAKYNEIVDECLLNLTELNLPGVQLLLGSSYTAAKQDYRFSEIQQLFKLNVTSEYAVECLMAMLPLVPGRSVEVFELVCTTSEHIRKAGIKAIHNVDPAQIPKIKEICVSKMAECSLFVAFLAEIPNSEPELAEALNLDPESRVYAITQLSNCDLLSKCLNDYTTDMRGDIGSIVRAAALRRILQLNHLEPDLEPQIWKIASESSTKTRPLAFEVLNKLKNTRIHEYADLLNCPPQFRAIVSRGLISCVGSLKSNSTTRQDSFKALVQAFKEPNTWLLNEILVTPRRTLGTVKELLKTLKTAIVFGLDFKSLRPLAVAFNTSLNSKLPEQVLMDCIDIMQIYMPNANAKKGLMKLLDCPYGSVRQRSAEALFECGYTSSTIMNTDFTLPRS